MTGNEKNIEKGADFYLHLIRLNKNENYQLLTSAINFFRLLLFKSKYNHCFLLFFL